MIDWNNTYKTGLSPNWTTHQPSISSAVQPATINPAAPQNTLGEVFKPKKAGKTRSHVVFVLDDSYSMQSCRDTTISGFNEYLAAQKHDEETTGIKTFVSLFKFNGSDVTCVVDRVAVKEVQPLNRDTYNPRGSTNLLDAIGGVMLKVNEQLKENKKKNRESVIVTVLTDGAENCSRVFSNADIKQMVEKAEGKNWGFMFLGANIDAFGVSSQLGFNVQNTMQYDTAHMGESIRSASAMTTRLKSAYAAGMDTRASYAEHAFTAEERSSAVEGDKQ